MPGAAGRPVAARGELPGYGSRLVIQGKIRDGETRFEAVVVLEPEGKTARVVASEAGKLEISGADAATLILVGASSFVNYRDIRGDPSARNVETLARLEGVTHSRLLNNHLRDYQALFRRVTLDLGITDAAKLPTDERIKEFQTQNDPQLAALYFQYGRYLLIASSRPGSQPANLQGIWNDQTNPPWDSKYTININTQMNYWPAETTNLAECHEPLFDLIGELREAGRRTARAHYGASGFVAHHNTDLWRVATPVDGARWGLWPLGGAWLATHLFEHYAFSGDIAFLRSVYPTLKEASEFVLDFLVEDDDGHLVTNPSHSPDRPPAGGVSARGAVASTPRRARLATTSAPRNQASRAPSAPKTDGRDAAR